MLRAGIIGLGVGEAHIAGYEANRGCKVVALCDFDLVKRRMAQKKYPGKKITPKAEEVLTDPNIDIVSIASFDNFHYEQICLALKHNKHVFVEKPLCLFEKEARGIRKLLKSQRHLRLSSNLILRRVPRFIWLKDQIKKQKLGNIFSIEGDYNYGRIQKLTDGWRGKIDYYSVVLGGGVHMIDLMLWLTGKNIKSVAAFGNRIATKGSRFRYNDCVACLLEFDNGMVGKMTANFGCVHPHFHVLNVYGTKATFINEIKDAQLIASRDPKASVTRIDKPYPGVHKGDLLINFVQGILNKKKLIVDEEDVFRAVSVCLAIDKAVKKESKCKVVYI